MNLNLPFIEANGRNTGALDFTAATPPISAYRKFYAPVDPRRATPRCGRPEDHGGSRNPSTRAAWSQSMSLYSRPAQRARRFSSMADRGGRHRGRSARGGQRRRRRNKTRRKRNFCLRYGRLTPSRKVTPGLNQSKYCALLPAVSGTDSNVIPVICGPTSGRSRV